MIDDPDDPINQYLAVIRMRPLAVTRLRAQNLLKRLDEKPTIEAPPQLREELHRIASANG
jgi:hypothetical protein